MRRIDLERTARAVCLGCGYVIDGTAATGAGASHARSRRHVVRVECAVTFVLVPAEHLAETLGGGRP
ncbi:hypothetical protein ACH436_04235 [Isoptericola sp. NPDC019693]|uniref:hypothetical protein n=1 Tax=Isoptericola sp. NPDC019693 TaxID=3364009 RepID=UPI0037A4613B